MQTLLEKHITPTITECTKRLEMEGKITQVKVIDSFKICLSIKNLTEVEFEVDITIFNKE